MKYLKKFETEADKTAWIESDVHVMPNVVLTEGAVEYNVKIDPASLPLYVEAIENLTIKFGNNYEYSKDKATWSSGTGSTTISANAGEKVYFRASGLNPSESSGIGSFTISNGRCNVAGNVMSMAYGADFKGKSIIEKQYQFASLFKNNKQIVDASKLILPATTLEKYCYHNTFRDCTSLVNAPALPATTLAIYCYVNTFRDCTSLVNAPVLPATTLESSCYVNTFNGCTSLSFIKAMFTTAPGTYTSNWVSGVSSSGTFVKNSAATWDVTGVNGVPEGWTIETASA